MEYGPDIICPKCATRHGPAATRCECGHVFEVPEEEPSPPSHFFGLALFFGIVTFGAAMIADKKGYIYLPIGGLIFAGTAAAFGVQSWFYYYRKRKQEENQPPNGKSG